MRVVAAVIATAALSLGACSLPGRSAGPRSETAAERSGAAAPELGGTPATRALAEWLRVYNVGNNDSSLAFANRWYTPQELQAVTPAGIARGHRLWKSNYGRMRLVTIDSSAAFSVEATVHQDLTTAYGKLFVDVDSMAPHRISGVWLIPFVPNPATARAGSFSSDSALITALDQFVSRLESAEVFSGVVQVQRKDQRLYARAVGPARRQPLTANSLGTQFELASLSKLFTAVAVGKLVERGIISFETRVGGVLPDYPNPAAAQRLTVHHLLTHTSGIPDLYRNGKFRQFEDSLRSLRDFWRTFAYDSLEFAPGSRYSYSNSNYLLLGSMIERLTGGSFETFVEREVFAPAGMTRTCYCPLGSPDRATPYSRYTAGFGPTRRASPDRWTEVPEGSRRPGAPAGGGISTAADLTAFSLALLEGRLLRAESLSELLEPRVPMENLAHRSYGFEITRWNGVRYVGHGGNYWGTMSQLDIYPETGYTVVVLSNNDASGGEAIRHWLRTALTSKSGRF